jgi:flagellar basal-body rod modification protein FlgD
MSVGGSDASSNNDSSSSSATISANDFLSLLVTEMQNQDPTADTDPNEYINQLVQVNSLEQLIDINQNLTTALGSSGSPTGQAPGASAAGASAGGSSRITGGAATGTSLPARPGSAQLGMSPPAPARAATTVAAIQQFANSQMSKSVGAAKAPGNLSVPRDHPAAHRVGHALDGRGRAVTTNNKAAGKP